MPRRRQGRLLAIHFALFQTGASLAGVFIGAYLLQRGFTLAGALASYALFLGLRTCLRFAALEVVRRAGYVRALTLGTVLVGLQFLPLIAMADWRWFAAWLLCVAAGESLYWPLFHTAMAVSGDNATRGRQVGGFMTVVTLVNVAAPLAGGWLLAGSGPAVTFGLATASILLSAVPFLGLRGLQPGPAPSARQTLTQFDRVAVLAFAADGWLSAGIIIGWPMVLFLSLGSHYQNLGLSSAAAGVVGACVSYWCGRAIDRGHRDAYLRLVCWLLVATCGLRSLATWSPLASIAAALSGAGVMALYIPVLMSMIYDRGKRSGATMRYHFALEAGWDCGGVLGCLAAAGVAWLWPGMPSLAVLPSVMTIGVIYRCVRAEALPGGGGLKPTLRAVL